MTNQPTTSTSIRALAGLAAGVVGGLVLALTSSPPLDFKPTLIFGAVLGLIFGLVFGPRVGSAGAGLVWGEAYGLLSWLIAWLTLIPMVSGQGLRWTTIAVRETFPLLLGHVVGYGAVLGFSYYVLVRGFAGLASSESAAPSDPPERRIPTGQAIVRPLVRAVIIGGVGGLLGSWVFMRGIESAEFFPLVAGLMGSESMLVGTTLHCVIGTMIGITFGLLFYRDIHGAGSGLAWGMNYGLFWWVIGPLTLMPWFLGMRGRPDWSITAVQNAAPSLVAHLLYGALVGLFYALAHKLWRVLFVDSDPLNRPLEGAGTRGLRGVLMGLAAGIIGGLLFTIVMVGVGALPMVASLVGAESAFAGFVVHLTIAIIIGSSYGLLFQREAYSYGSGLAWGLVYGVLWWFLGAVTLFPILLRQPVDWSLQAVVALYPSLVGHLLYGAVLGLFFQFLARRYDTELSSRAQRGTQGTRFAYPASRRPQRRCAGTPASALWAVILALGVMLPLLLL